MNLIKNDPGYQLKATILPSLGGTFSLELHQHWPKAQRPEWRRITQLNLTHSELDALAAVLIRK
jgi:hypothetical protein